MLTRYRAMSASDVFSCSHPITLLFAWQQAGDEQGPRQLVESSIIGDEALIQTLEHLTSAIVSSNRGKFDVLKKDHLAHFMDIEKAAERIHTLSNDDILGARARLLEIVFEDGEKY